MAALAWLIIPLLAAVAAAFWGRWASGHRATGDGASLAGYERFRTAMEGAGGRGRHGRARRAAARRESPGPGAAQDAGEEPAPAAAEGLVAEFPQAAADGLVVELPQAPRDVSRAGEEGSPRGPLAGPVP